MNRGGTKFRRVLTAVALLGSAIPAVPGLKPLRETVFDDDENEFHRVTLTRELKDMAKKTDDEIAAERAAEMAAKDAEIAALTAKLDDADKGGNILEMNKMKDTLADNEKRMATLEKDRHSERVENRVKTLGIPSLHNHFRGLYDFAAKAESADPEMKITFKVGESEGKIGAVELVDNLIETINKHAGKLFNEMAAHDADAGNGRGDHGDVSDPETAGKELDKLTLALMAKDGKLEYDKAFAAILADPENAELKEQYAV